MKEHVIAYIVTVAAVALIAIIGWRRARTPVTFGFIFPAWYALYSFIGPLPFILGEGFDQFSEAYRVWDKMYPLLDGPHVWEAHVVYASFLFSWAVAYFAFPMRRRAAPGRTLATSRDAPGFTRTASVGAAIALGIVVIGSLWTKYGTLMLAGTSIYAAKATREQELLLTTMDKGLFSLWGASLVAATIASQRLRRRGWILVTCWIAFLCSGMAMGDRSQTFTFILAGAFACVLDRPGSRRRVVIAVAALSLALLVANALVKRHRNTGGTTEAQATLLETAADPHYLIFSALGSVESFAAYAALPILIDCGAQPNGGQSLLRLIDSFVPRIIADGRPTGSGSYKEYTEIAGIDDSKQGFCIHFVADSYLNFGFVGAAGTGALLGGAMALLEAAGRRPGSLFWMAAWLTVLGAIPAHLRGGIEGLRAVVYEYWLMPFLLLVAVPWLARCSSGTPALARKPMCQ